MLDWDDFKYFSAVAHTGSVRGAGKMLGVNASTVTRRLEQFERRLGIRLFARTRGGLIITPEGAEVVQALDEVATRLEDIERRLRGRDTTLAGRVRVNVPEVFTGELFMSGVAQLCRAHPDLVVEVHRAWQAPDLGAREGDLAIVVSDAPPGHLIGRPLGHMSLAGYRHLEADPESSQRWLTSALEQALAPDFADRVGSNHRIGGYLATVDLQLAAALAGAGSTLLPCYLGDGQAQLVRVTGSGTGRLALRRELWLLSHPDSRGVARVQVVADLLLDALRGHDLDV